MHALGDQHHCILQHCAVITMPCVDSTWCQYIHTYIHILNMGNLYMQHLFNRGHPLWRCHYIWGWFPSAKSIKCMRMPLPTNSKTKLMKGKHTTASKGAPVNPIPGVCVCVWGGLKAPWGRTKKIHIAGMQEKIHIPLQSRMQSFWGLV